MYTQNKKTDPAYGADVLRWWAAFSSLQSHSTIGSEKLNRMLNDVYEVHKYIHILYVSLSAILIPNVFPNWWNIYLMCILMCYSYLICIHIFILHIYLLIPSVFDTHFPHVSCLILPHVFLSVKIIHPCVPYLQFSYPMYFISLHPWAVCSGCSLFV